MALDPEVILILMSSILVIVIWRGFLIMREINLDIITVCTGSSNVFIKGICLL